MIRIAFLQRGLFKGVYKYYYMGCCTGIGALIIRIGFWVHYNIIIIRNPPKIVEVMIKAPILGAL